jgi:VanZ family protein
MLVPFGFFGTAALAGAAPGVARRALACAVVLSVSLVLSVTIETLQVFVPRRTPSLADIQAQAVGTAIGAFAWAALGRECGALLARFASGSRRALEAVLAGYAAIRYLLLLGPLDVSVGLPELARKFRTGGVVLNPLASPALRWEQVPALLSDVVLAAPVGVLAMIAATPPGTRRRVPSAVFYGGLFFLSAEIAQLFVRSRRADVADLAANALGVAAGALLAAAVTTRVVGARQARPASHAVLTGGIVVAALLYAAYNLSPFDFTFSRAQVASRAGMLAGVPFHAYYVNQEFKALADLFLKVSLALPLGVLFQMRWRPDDSPFRRSLVTGWLVVSAAFFSAVEVGQVFLPSRFPDNSDIILGVGAVWLGMRLARPFSRASRSEQP